MLVQFRQPGLARRVTIAYCRACHFLFGKTLSVMAGEADAAGRWYGTGSAAFIDWLLRDRDHCAKQLTFYRRARREVTGLSLLGENGMR